MAAYTSQNVRSVTVRNIHEVGYDKLTSVCAQIENYLDTTKGMLWVTASFDYTGLYDYVGGEYLDGLNWVPDEGYGFIFDSDGLVGALRMKGFDTMMEEYANVTSAIRAALETDGGIDPEDDGDDPEIMEFLPE